MWQVVRHRSPWYSTQAFLNNLGLPRSVLVRFLPGKHPQTPRMGAATRRGIRLSSAGRREGLTQPAKHVTTRGTPGVPEEQRRPPETDVEGYHFGARQQYEKLREKSVPAEATIPGHHQRRPGRL